MMDYRLEKVTDSADEYGLAIRRLELKSPAVPKTLGLARAVWKQYLHNLEAFPRLRSAAINAYYEAYARAYMAEVSDVQ